MRISFYWMCITQWPRAVGDKLTRKEQPEEERGFSLNKTSSRLLQENGTTGKSMGYRTRCDARGEGRNMCSWRSRYRYAEQRWGDPATAAGPAAALPVLPPRSTHRHDEQTRLLVSLSRPPLPFPLLCACVRLAHTTLRTTVLRPHLNADPPKPVMYCRRAVRDQYY